jgi:hypothetical protein
LAVAAGLLAAACAVGPGAPAPAAPTTGAVAADQCALTLDVAASPTAAYIASGTLTAGGHAVSGATVAVKANDISGSGVTDKNGNYSVTLQIPKGGDYTVTASTPVSSACGNQATASKTVTVEAFVDLSVDLGTPTVTAGEQIYLSGKLVSRGTPIEAVLTITGSWENSQQATALTGADGTWQQFVVGPAQGGSQVTLTVTYPGDGFYTATSQTVSVFVEAAPTASPSASASAQPSATPSATPSPSPAAAAPTATASPDAVTPPWERGSRLFVVALIFIIVAALATSTLLIIGVVSRQRRGLAADERRGFGSDFGKGRSADDDASLDDLLGGDEPIIDHPDQR